MLPAGATPVYHAVIYSEAMILRIPRVTDTPGDGARVDYRLLADLRYQMRRFLRTREVAARAVRVEPQQYLLLLQVKGLPRRQAPTIRALAERLQISHHGTVQLVDRLVRRGLVRRRRVGRDRREVVVELRAAGEALLRRLTIDSVAELKTEGPALVSSLRQLLRSSTGDGRPLRSESGEERR